MKFGTLALALLMSQVSTGAMAAGSAIDGLNTMRALNLIVLGNYDARSDVEGKTYVGGNVTGGASLGIGSSANGQGQAVSDFLTVSIGGSNFANLNVNSGNYGAAAPDHLGAYVVGAPGNLNINAPNATVKIGGSINGNINLSQGTSLDVVGNLGAVSGNGSNTIRVGGSAGTSGSVNISNGASSIAVVGNLSNANLAANSVNTVGGNANNINGSNNAKLYVGGSITGNANTNGGTFTSNYAFAGPVPAPTVPVVGSLAATTQQIADDVKALSTALGGLTIVSNPSTITYGSQGPTFHAVDGGNGFALFNVTESIFNYAEFNYDFANTTLPVVINVTNSNSLVSAAKSATYNWNANPVGGANNQHNQQVIWNFLDAGTLNLNRQVQGSILAPYATVRNASDVNGSVVAAVFNQGGEVHLGTVRGFDLDGKLRPPVTPPVGGVPEPAIWAQLIAGFGLAGIALRRRRTAIA